MLRMRYIFFKQVLLPRIYGINNDDQTLDTQANNLLYRVPKTEQAYAYVSRHENVYKTRSFNDAASPLEVTRRDTS